jgi:hypothetical protein
MREREAILPRKNSLFQRTKSRALLGDIFLKLISTREFSAANSFHRLTRLPRYAAEPSAKPHDWMSWNYRQRLATASNPAPKSPAAPSPAPASRIFRPAHACRKDTLS